MNGWMGIFSARCKSVGQLFKCSVPGNVWGRYRAVSTCCSQLQVFQPIQSFPQPPFMSSFSGNFKKAEISKLKWLVYQASSVKENSKTRPNKWKEFNLKHFVFQDVWRGHCGVPEGPGLSQGGLAGRDQPREWSCYCHCRWRPTNRMSSYQGWLNKVLIQIL